MSITSGASESGSGSGPMRVSFAQSSAIRTRSRQSSGRRRRSSASGMKAYSRGSGASPYRYIPASLPSRSSASFIARMDPRASPSGFSWVTRRNRSWSRIAFATPSRSVVVWGELIDQLRHPNPPLDGGIVFEGELRRPLHSELAGDARLEHAVGRGEAGEAVFPRFLGAEDADEHASVTEVRRRLDRGHGDEPDARILQLADGLREHLANGLVHAAHSVSHRGSRPPADSGRARSPGRRGSARRRRAAAR